jgi:hypothetical protein
MGALALDLGVLQFVQVPYFFKTNKIFIDERRFKVMLECLPTNYILIE